MKAGDAIAEILKREGIDTIIGYPGTMSSNMRPSPTSGRSSCARSAPASTWPPPSRG
jgi:hypothetical protein